MSSVPRLSGHDLGCIRGDTPVFKGVSFQISQGKSLHLIGANGVGKSSLLRMITGLLPVGVGRLEWSEFSSSPFQQRCVLVNHKQGLKPQLTVAETVRFWSGLRPNQGLSVSQVLEAWGLLDLADFPTALLSQGQRQRLNLCRLQVFSAWLWLLDEPFSGLDSAAQENLSSMMQQHQHQGGSIMLATHLVGSNIWQPDNHLDLTAYRLLRVAA